MKDICFFNFYHNGDIFHSKSFVKEIINSIDTKFYYAHSNDPIILNDLNVDHAPLPQIDSKTKIFETEDTVYVNTWIGSYHDPDQKYLGECTLRFSYEMFSKIYAELNLIFNSNLQLSEISNYIPTIDYSKFNVLEIENYIKETPGKKVLLSNGECLSGQCQYNGDMLPIVEQLANEYPEVNFILTKPLPISFDNVTTTNDIIKSSGCDLNEIGYLSTFCDLIIGRNSGPFCFCTNKDNINNPNTFFYVFANDVTTCFLYEMYMECSFTFEYFDSIDNTINSIKNIIQSIIEN
jgi:hypothetical protein